MPSKQTRFKRFKGWFLSFILIDLITLFTRSIESLFSKDKRIITLFFTENNFADNSRYFLEFLLADKNHDFKVRILVKNKSLYKQIHQLYPEITFHSKSINGFD